MKYAHLEKDTNKLLGWYDSKIHSVIPTPNIEVTDKVWQEAININTNCYKDGKFIVKDFRTDDEIEAQRKASIKAKAGGIIKSKYSIEWQLNHPRLDSTYVNEYAWLDNIRKISNEAEAKGTKLEDINWGV